MCTNKLSGYRGETKGMQGLGCLATYGMKNQLIDKNHEK